MKTTTAFCLAVLSVVLFTASASYAGGANDVLYQVSTFGVLKAGVYDGQEYISELLQHGGFGIGTFDNLDGDMVALDGVYYRTSSDGSAKKASYNSKTPYAVVTFFEPDHAWKLKEPADLGSLESFLDDSLPDDGLIYAIKVKGLFLSVEVGSLKSQLEIMKNPDKPDNPEQVQYGITLKNLNGTLVGFRFPKYMGGFNITGYHFHFIGSNQNFGGHVVNCSIMNGEVEADATNQYFVALPEEGLPQQDGSADEGAE
jgi:acetolactate decarboxylase